MTRVVALIVLVAVCIVQAGDRLRVRLPGAFATAPADIAVTVYLEPEPEDRAMVFAVQGEPGTSLNSTWELDGLNSWHVRQDWVKALPAGCYVMYASVYGADGKLRSVAHSPMLTVIGREGNPCED